MAASNGVSRTLLILGSLARMTRLSVFKDGVVGRVTPTPFASFRLGKILGFWKDEKLFMITDK